MIIRVLKIISRFLFIIGIPLVIFSAVVAIAFNCVSVYEYGFNKYDVASQVGISKADLIHIAKDLVAYFDSPSQEYLDTRAVINGQETNVYNTDELIHMKDVKGLVRLDYGFLLVSFIYTSLYCALWLWRRAEMRKLARSILAGGLITLVIMLALWIGSLINFNWLFLHFHYIAFSNNFWSAQGNMLKLFPGGFWYDIVLYCAIAMAVTSAVIAAVAAFYLYRTGKGLFYYHILA